MTGFERRTSGIGSDCSTNWATQLLPLISLVWSTYYYHDDSIMWIHVYKGMGVDSFVCLLLVFDEL